MPYVAPQGFWGTVVCLFFVILISLTKNFNVFIHTSATNFDYKNFITGYLGIPLYIILLFGHMLVTKSKGVKPHEADFYTGKEIIDAQEAEYLEKEEVKNANSEGMRKFYNRYIAWLF
jgi:amino acid transporter